MADGFAYLKQQNLDREGVLVVASALGLTDAEHLGRSQLEEKIVKQARNNT